MNVYTLEEVREREGRKSQCNEIYVAHKHAAAPLANKA